MKPDVEELEKIEELEKDEQFADDFNESPPSDIVAYSELRSCADLLRMHEEGNLQIQPDFQRDIVWNGSDQTRFIDSLIKQLPIPSLCFAYDYKKSDWIVIDGLQRISTIVKFLRGDDWKLANLDDIDGELAGKSAATIRNAKSGTLKVLYTRVQNQTLPINVLRCDFTKSRHNEYLFTIFHRLNSGGVRLNNQEIRNCIFSGPFNNLLKNLDKNNDWRAVNYMKEGDNRRFTKQEVILRFFAFLYDEPKYKGSLSKFLNDFMFRHRFDGEDLLLSHKEIFERVVKILAQKAFPEGAPARLSNTVLEGMMIGIAANINLLESQSADVIQKLADQFRRDESVSETSLSEGLSKKDKVEARLRAARTIFSCEQ